MKTLEELKEFYDTTLIKDLQVLEGQRKELVNRFLIVGACILCVVAVGAGFAATSGNPVMIFIPLVIGLIIGGIVMSVMSKGYVQDFKSKIIAKIVRFVDDSLAYTQQSCISESVYMSSKIFRQRPDRYKGEDLVSGKVGATKIEFSEIHSEYKTTTTDSKGRTQTHWHTIFKGLFFIADFNKHFAGETVVLPDTAERLFGRIGQKLQSLNTFRGKLIKLEDPEFEKLFVVYGDDQIEARYILSTSLMARITDFKKKTKKPLHLSFVGSNVFVAISYSRNLFEPRMFQTLLDFGPVRQYFEDVRVAVGIVEDLNLNTRIWTKT